ncbi:MAG: hypothetical protein ACR2QS_09445 [Woeseiaceae bacterium]
MEEQKVSKSFWVIASVGLLFNLMGCVNFISQFNAEMVASMPDAYRLIIESRPMWATVAFAIAVFGGAIGCVLLLLRKSAAINLLGLSLAGAVAAQLPAIGNVELPMQAWVGWVSQLVIGALLLWYAVWASGKKWLA